MDVGLDLSCVCCVFEDDCKFFLVEFRIFIVFWYKCVVFSLSNESEWM